MDQRAVQREPLVHDWLQYIREVDQENERIIADGNKFWIPFLAIPTQVVAELFMIADRYDLAPNTRYMALYLYDTFMCNTFWETHSNPNGVREPKIFRKWWKQMSRRILDHSKLRLMSCIQIASKMDSHSAGLGISQVINILLELDGELEYTPNTVFHSEFKVFETVGFKIPIGTPLDCIEILLCATGLQSEPQIYDTIIKLLDLTYLQHHRLYATLQFTMNGRSAQTPTERKNFRAMEINSLCIGASVILCTALLYSWEKERIDMLATQLADLVNIDANDLQVIADVLFHIAYLN